MHRRFSHLNRFGEWFAFHDEMLSVIPPDETPVIVTIKKRRDVKLTISEKLTNSSRLADDIGIHGKSKLLIFIAELTEDQAELVFETIAESAMAKGCRDHAREIRGYIAKRNAANDNSSNRVIAA